MRFDLMMSRIHIVPMVFVLHPSARSYTLRIVYMPLSTATQHFSASLCAPHTCVCVCMRLLVCAPYTTTDAPMRPLLLLPLPQPQLFGYSAVYVHHNLYRKLYKYIIVRCFCRRFFLSMYWAMRFTTESYDPYKIVWVEHDPCIRTHTHAHTHTCILFWFLFEYAWFENWPTVLFSCVAFSSVLGDWPPFPRPF